MKHVVAVSGGKDSSALALALKVIEPRDYLYICTPTSDELPEMEQHWKTLSRLLKSPIHRIDPGCSLTELIYRERMIPNFRARFCTRILKIEPTQEFLNKLGECTLYVGLRADEDRKGGVYDCLEQRFPLQEWGWVLKDVLSYLNKAGITIPNRTGCAMCYHQRISEWWNLWHYYPDRYAHAERIESDLGHTFRSPRRDTWPAPLKDLRDSFESGRLTKKDNVNRNLSSDRRVCSL